MEQSQSPKMNFSAIFTIPQLFYDIIARIIPGIIFILGVIIIITGYEETIKDIKTLIVHNKDKNISILMFLFLTLPLAYITAYFLAGIHHLCTCLPLKKLYAKIKIDKEKYKYDYIRIMNPGIAAVIIKKRAEKRMIDLMITGSVILAIIQTIINYREYQVIIFIFLYGISIISYKLRLINNYNNCLENNYKIIKKQLLTTQQNELDY